MARNRTSISDDVTTTSASEPLQAPQSLAQDLAPLPPDPDLQMPGPMPALPVMGPPQQDGEVPKAQAKPSLDGKVVGTAKGVDVSAPRQHGKVYRVERGGQMVGPNGHMSTIRAGKLIDDRYFDVRAMKRQGFVLVEVDPAEL